MVGDWLEIGSRLRRQPNPCLASGPTLLCRAVHLTFAFLKPCLTFACLQAARARACGNLGNAFSALSDYTQALQYYNQSLTIAKEARNRAGEGQVGKAVAVLSYRQQLLESVVDGLTWPIGACLPLARQSIGRPSWGQLEGWLLLRCQHMLSAVSPPSCCQRVLCLGLLLPWLHLHAAEELRQGHCQPSRAPQGGHRAQGQVRPKYVCLSACLRACWSKAALRKHCLSACLHLCLPCMPPMLGPLTLAGCSASLVQLAQCLPRGQERGGSAQVPHPHPAAAGSLVLACLLAWPMYSQRLARALMRPDTSLARSLDRLPSQMPARSQGPAPEVATATARAYVACFLACLLAFFLACLGLCA